MEWRNVGPLRGGRSQAVAGHPAQRDVYYFGATGGGLWQRGVASWDEFHESDPASLPGRVQRRYDDHAAHLGFGTVDGEEFRYEDPPGEVYSKGYRFSVGEGRRALESTQYANGTRLVVERVLETKDHRPEESLRRVSYTDGNVRYERRTYEEGYRPEILEPHVYLDEQTNSVYEREQVEEEADGSSYELRQAFTRYSYVENGSQERGGRTYGRYDLLDPRSPFERLTGAREPRGYMLVDEGNRVRYGELGLEGEPVRAEPQVGEHLAPESLVAGLHVGEVEVVEHVGEQRQRLVAEIVPEQVHPLRAPEEA
jgi:hypothetical protein